MKIGSMRNARQEHRMVAYGNAIYAVGGWTQSADAFKSTEWFDGSSWSERSWYYGDWPIAVSCLASDPEGGVVYSLGGYSPP